MKDRLITFHEYHGSEILPHLTHVGQMRIKLFRAFPYLYDGNLDYEISYLQGLAENRQSQLLVAEVDHQPVGIATALPLISSAEILAQAHTIFRQADINPAACYYYSEILVEPEFRGLGIASEFYQLRANHARSLGFHNICFAAIEQPDDHPQRPSDYHSPVTMWQRMGFQRHPEMQMTFQWPTLRLDGTTQNQSHQMIFWLKSLTAE